MPPTNVPPTLVPSPTQTKVPPTTSFSPTQMPPSTMTPVIQLPKDYSPYGTFTSQGSLNTDWWLDDGIKMCNLNVRDARLFFDCRNTTITDTVATLHPSRQSGGSGVAIIADVGKIGGAVELATNWKCKTDNSERAYHIAIHSGLASATEYYPQDNWRMVSLGDTIITVGQTHLFHIERNNDAIAFYVDNKVIPLKTMPNISPCFTMSDWGVDFLVWKNGNNVQGDIVNTGVR